MPVQTTIKATPDPKVLAKNIRKITRGLNDWRPVWTKLLPEMIKAVGGHFRTGGATTGNRWPPSKDPGRSTMILTGALVQNLTSRAGVGKEINQKTIAIFPNIGRYPFMVHAGAKRAGKHGRGGYPARPFLIWTDPAIRKAEKLSDEFVRTQTDKLQKGITGL